MNKLNFDGRLLEGKNVAQKIRDLITETDFSGNETEIYYTYPDRNYYQKKNSFKKENCI